MTEIRIVKNRDAWRRHGWSATPNALILDPVIPWEAKGAFAWLSLAADDPEFDATALSLAAAGPKGRDHAKNMLRILEEHGWLTRTRAQDGRGVPVLVYDLQPQPVVSEARTFRPSTAKPRKDKFPQVRAEKLVRQSFGPDLRVVDNSIQAPNEAPDAKSVSAGQGPKTDASVTDASVTGPSVVLTSSLERLKSIPPSDSLTAAPEVVPTVSEEGGRESQPEEKNDQDGDQAQAVEPSGEALAEVAALEFGRHRRPTRSQARTIAGLLDAAVAHGLTLRQARDHAQTAIRDARTNAVSYLVKAPAGALLADNLPVPYSRRTGTSSPVEAAPQPLPAGEALDRAAALDLIRATTRAGRPGVLHRASRGRGRGRGRS